MNRRKGVQALRSDHDSVAGSSCRQSVAGGSRLPSSSWSQQRCCCGSGSGQRQAGGIEPAAAQREAAVVPAAGRTQTQQHLPQKNQAADSLKRTLHQNIVPMETFDPSWEFCSEQEQNQTDVKVMIIMKSRWFIWIKQISFNGFVSCLYSNMFSLPVAWKKILKLKQDLLVIIIEKVRNHQTVRFSVCSMIPTWTWDVSCL